MNDQIDGLLTQIPEPAPPPSFKATVMARIAREADRPLPDVAVMRLERRRDRRAWMLIPTGLLLAAGATAYPYLAAMAVPNLSLRTSPITLGLIPAGGSLAIVAGMGLLVYLAGLFATLAHGESSRPRHTS